MSGSNFLVFFWLVISSLGSSRETSCGTNRMNVASYHSFSRVKCLQPGGLTGSYASTHWEPQSQSTESTIIRIAEMSHTNPRIRYGSGITLNLKPPSSLLPNRLLGGLDPIALYKNGVLLIISCPWKILEETLALYV